MKETRATSAGLDLHLDLSGGRPRARLESALREAVRGGRLMAGTAMPSSRALARDLGLARNTVAEAYGQLVAEGWLSARHGSGTWVTQRVGQLPSVGTAASRSAGRGPRYDLRPGVPDVSAFPRAAWLAAARKALAAASAAELSYADPRGLPGLRTALAEYLARARGVAVTPDRIVVCAGFSQGLELVCEVLRARGARELAVEAYGHPQHRGIAARSGLRVVPLPVDDRGADVAVLPGSRPLARRAGPPRLGAVLLTPAHQFPLGVILAPDRRRQIADWAATTGAVVIEDDYDGEFRYDRQAVGALQPLAPESVVYAGTASKSLAPGLRLGWLVVPADLLDPIVDAKRAAGRLSSSLDQLALAELIRSGGYDRQVRRARLAYRRRRDRLIAALAAAVPDVRVAGIAAGLHALVRLPGGVAERDVVTRAAARGLAVHGLATTQAGEQDLGPALIIGYATPPPYAFSTAIARLCAALREVIGA
ncbi:MAG TPA: PLP-dependent aminotransferase family protein [Streptosporangiaceae bacterium]|nr:PLP-dependent aminotransferase family protein [Streptosporangiaceae bacterium]